MRFTEKLYIKLDLKLDNIPPYILHEGLTGVTTCHHVATSTVLLDGGTCLAFKPDNEMEYLVGTEEHGNTFLHRFLKILLMTNFIVE